MFPIYRIWLLGQTKQGEMWNTCADWPDFDTFGIHIAWLNTRLRRGVGNREIVVVKKQEERQ